MRRALACLLLLAVVGLAGCGGKGAKGAEADFSGYGLEATDSTGLIRGVVVDATVKPLLGAKVVLKATNATVTTAEDGLFGFDGLEPGTYFLDVSLRGFASQQTSAEVEAGVAEPRIVKVQLAADPTSLPYPQQYTYTGYVSCSFKVGFFVFDASSCDPTGAAGFAGRDDANPFFDVDRVPTFFQSEIVWDSTQPAGDELVTIQLACQDGPCGENDDNRLCNVRGVKPLVCRVNATASSDGGADGGGGHGLDQAMQSNRTGFTVGVYANCDPCAAGNVGFGLTLEQQFQVFTTVFYGYTPPEDWLFVEDQYIPPPPA